MEFYDINVRIESLKELDEVIEMAKKLGYSGIGLVENYANLDQFKKIKDMARSVKEIKIFPGIEIEANGVRELKRMVYKARKFSNFIIVSGGEYKINRAAVEDSRVSMLSHPEYKRSDSGMDHIIAKLAAEKNVAIEINFHEILETFRKVRSFVLNHMKMNVELAQKYGAPIVITSGAKGKWEMRDPRELAAIGQILGMNLEDSMKSVSEIPERVAGGLIG